VIVSVVDCVIGSSHDWLSAGRDRVMNASRPDTREEEKEHVSEVVHRDEEESHDIGRSLEHSIKGVKGDRSPRGERLVLVVFVMESVNIFVQELVCVQCPMHPVDPNLKENNIEKEIKEIELPSTNIRNIEIDLCEIIFNEKLRDHRKTSVDKDRRLSKKDLINNNRGLRERTTFASE
jgi:hypothetical protein